MPCTLGMNPIENEYFCIVDMTVSLDIACVNYLTVNRDQTSSDRA